MTISKRLNISFFLILFIIVFIIGVFFYSIYNLNKIHLTQNHRYEQIRKVEKLKEYNNSFSWIVLDIITDYDKKEIVEKRLNKAKNIYQQLLRQKDIIINNHEALDEKENLILVFSNFDKIDILIQQDLVKYILKTKNDFTQFNKRYDQISKQTQNLLNDEIEYLQNKLYQTEYEKDDFIDKIKIELVILLLIAFLLSFIISSKLTKEIKGMLKKLNKGVLALFKDDENIIKIDIEEKNELTEITNTLNSYLEKQSDIIHSREELLRNISHELKTPITKGKFLLERLKDKKDDTAIHKIKDIFYDIEELTHKLLEREKLNFATLNFSKFKSSSLILESLSKLSIEDESIINLQIEDDFYIHADKYYLTIALKNLIDNAIKYAKNYPIEIIAKENTIYVNNQADKLSNKLIYYTQPFTREPNQQIGHGLGLNIVSKILHMHKFILNYQYKEPHNSFSITF